MDPARRNFLAAGTLTAAGLGLAGAESLAAGNRPQAGFATSSGEPLFKKGDTLLFQGDSITDTHRDRSIAEPNNAAALGNGYAFLAAARLMLNYGEDYLNIYNRGVSGNKVFQLAERWQRDCLDLKPDVVSILIGVNDIWHWLKGEYDGTIETYRDDYRALCDRTKTALPNTRLVICQPFVLKVGAVDEKWFPKFDEFRSVAKEVADEYGDAWVPFDTMINQAARKVAPAKTWAPDGVHPSTHGAALLADLWLGCMGV